MGRSIQFSVEVKTDKVIQMDWRDILSWNEEGFNPDQEVLPGLQLRTTALGSTVKLDILLKSTEFKLKLLLSYYCFIIIG